MFVIEDEFHAEWIGEFPDRESALQRLRELSAVPWDQAPNQAPCMSWRTCGRNYELIEYEGAIGAARELHRTLALSISADGVVWRV